MHLFDITDSEIKEIYKLFSYYICICYFTKAN